jgi:hypothetical protein
MAAALAALNLYVHDVDDGLGRADAWDDMIAATRGHPGATERPETAANDEAAGHMADEKKNDSPPRERIEMVPPERIEMVILPSEDDVVLSERGVAVKPIVMQSASPDMPDVPDAPGPVDAAPSGTGGGDSPRAAPDAPSSE